MEYSEIISEAIGTLTVNKLRTTLATLGIVIGIGSVIALISLGQASQQVIQNQIQSLGANLLTVSPGAQRTGAVRGAAGGSTTLTNDDAKAIQTSPEITTVSSVSPEVDQRQQLTTGSNNTNIRVNGVTAAYALVHKINMDSGVFISDQDDLGMRKVVVIGPQVVTDLFSNGSDPIGQSVRMKGIDFLIETARECNALALPVVFRLVGPRDDADQDYRRAIERRAEGLVQLDGVKLGRQLCEEYLNSDLVIVPSANEAFGLTAVESLQHGVPVMFRPEVGKEIFREFSQVPGWLANGSAVSETIRGVVDFIRSYSTDAELRTRLAGVAREARGLFDSTTLAKAFVEWSLRQ